MDSTGHNSAHNTLLVIDPGLKLWGSERALLATLESLSACWNRVIVVTPKDAELADEIISNEKYGQIELRNAPIGNLHKRGPVARIIATIFLLIICNRERASRVYLNQAGLGRIVRVVACILRRPLVIHVRLIDDIPRISRIRGSRRFPVDLIFVSWAMAESFGCPANRYVKRHVSYDPYIFDLQVSNRIPIREFVCVGRISKGKGQHLLIDAMVNPSILKKCATLDIFGTGAPGDPYVRQIQAQIRAGDAVDRISVHGFRRDVLSRLADFRFLVAPSEYESLGRVVIEAWEAGIVPIVYAASGGAAEIVCASGGGLTFPDWTSEALAETMCAALALTNDEYHEMAARGRRWSKEALAIENYRGKLTGVLYPPFATEVSAHINDNYPI
jgi:glycosyltransferase involved in cell wall biosynthesis